MERFANIFGGGVDGAVYGQLNVSSGSLCTPLLALHRRIIDRGSTLSFSITDAFPHMNCATYLPTYQADHLSDPQDGSIAAP